MANVWYVLVMGEQIGPLSDDGLRGMVTKRQLTPDDMVRKEPSETWGPAVQVRGLFSQASLATTVQAPAMTSTPPLPSIAATAPRSTEKHSATEFIAEPKPSQLIACPGCKKRISPNASSCPNCGHAFFQPNRSVAIALAWILGGIGVHKFYLRKPGAGVVFMLFCWTLIPAIVALIEGFQYLFMDDETFARKFGSAPAPAPAPNVLHPRSVGGLATNTVQWVFAGFFLLLSFISLLSAWPVSVVMLLAGLSLIPPIQQSIDSLEIVQRYGQSIGSLWLWLLGTICLIAGAAAAIRFELMAMLLLSVIALCLLPVGWKWLSAEHEFVRQHHKNIRWILGLGAMLLAGFVHPNTRNGSVQSVQASDAMDAPYSVVEATTGDIKKTVVVTLDQKVSVDVLRGIATKIKDSDPKQYQRTYIAFYLPGMKVGTGAWATAKFDPNLTVTVIGISVDQENAIKRLPESPSRQVIGSWWDERPLLQNKMTFYRENGKAFMENKFDDGTASAIEMNEYSTPRGRKFTNKPDKGDFYLVNESGNLEWWDKDGHFLTSRKAE